ncbi:hypothetical protein WJX72_004813 [[Myrmecia] bisecta]|uniref:Uncharacterized protein n=1 Tax=[Myrmecia] bisecta TaxID=41462 RepID=A0AAW1PBV7_9CHLO
MSKALMSSPERPVSQQSKRFEFDDPRMECAFMCFQARKSSSSSVAILVLALMGLAGTRLAFIYTPVPGRLVVVLWVMAIVVPSYMALAVFLRFHTRTSLECLQHERIKAWAALLYSTATMVCVLLENQGEMGAAGAPVFLATIHAWMVPFYHVRIATARPLHALMYLNFLMTMGGRWCLATTHQSASLRFAWELLPAGLLISALAPLALSGILEAGSRAAFLTDLRARTGVQLPPALGPTWHKVLPYSGSQHGLMRGALAFW